MRRVASSGSVLQLPNATDSIKYSTTEEYGLLCYIQNVEMHFRNDIRTGWLCVHNMSTLDATLSE